MQIKIQKLHPKAILPQYKTEYAAGADLSACLDTPLSITPGEIVAIPTGIAIEIPPGYEGQVRPRSSLGKLGLSIPNAPGTIDSDYRGEVKVLLVNLSREPHTIYPGDRIAQLVIAPVVRGEFYWTSDLSPTSRGTGGFGSTGRNDAFQG
ncbi:dUTP diphosphatase [Thermospira aquatica]|uniref:Deoxyuridine 5'-triphosphate nucleotidohydrolase n=1 Tax=Thermospira aquatica TaxID=2828656 RepID=A0AAX3BAN0_9SPIR|nr:dUTP diphosphatase [Thermospira aquatica]URA09282.1 dUTP diphosphatase [Thermospira aquatica]